MVILFMLFVAQFGIACACLAFNKEQQHKLAYEGWHQASIALRNETQIYFDCCGFENATLPDDDPMKQAPCQFVSDINMFLALNFEVQVEANHPDRCYAVYKAISHPV